MNTTRVTSIDYFNTYFNFPVLAKIHVELTYETLIDLKTQLKINAYLVISGFRGG